MLTGGLLITVVGSVVATVLAHLLFPSPAPLISTPVMILGILFLYLLIKRREE